jgi:hypothetical protein
MPMTETPEERKERLRAQLARGAETRRKNAEARAAARAMQGADASEYIKPPRKPRNLDKIVREILNDNEIVDQVIANQPEYWGRLPSKNGAYIIATVMMVKAMGGDIKAADWIRKTGYGDKVLLESESGFFERSDFTIQVIPTKQTESIDSSIKADEVLKSEIKQIDDQTGTSDS